MEGLLSLTNIEIGADLTALDCKDHVVQFVFWCFILRMDQSLTFPHLRVMSGLEMTGMCLDKKKILLFFQTKDQLRGRQWFPSCFLLSGSSLAATQQVDIICREEKRLCRIILLTEPMCESKGPEART